MYREKYLNRRYRENKKLSKNQKIIKKKLDKRGWA